MKTGTAKKRIENNFFKRHAATLVFIVALFPSFASAFSYDDYLIFTQKAGQVLAGGITAGTENTAALYARSFEAGKSILAAAQEGTTAHAIPLLASVSDAFNNISNYVSSLWKNILPAPALPTPIPTTTTPTKPTIVTSSLKSPKKPAVTTIPSPQPSTFQPASPGASASSPSRDVSQDEPTVVQNIILPSTSSSDLNTKIEQLRNELLSKIGSLSSRDDAHYQGNFQAIALTNKIDQLTNTVITTPAITGGSITNASISGGSISGTTISGTTLSVSSGTFSGNLTVSGTATSTFAGDSAFDTDTLYIDSLNNRVGIATSSPSDTFALNGAAYFAQISAPSVTTNRLYNESGNLTWNGSVIGGASTGQWTLSGSDVYRSSGNVGIGTTSPYAKLSVVGPVVAEYFHATSTSATSTFDGRVVLNSTGFPDYDPMGEMLVLNATNSLNSTGDGNAFGHLRIRSTTNSVRMVLDAGANCGANTGCPATLLFAQSESPRWGIRKLATSETGSNVGSNFQFESFDDDGLHLGYPLTIERSTGNVLVGGSSSTVLPYARLDVRGIGSGMGQLIDFSNSASTTVMRLLDNGTGYFSGNVGIGTTSPYAKLSVVGETVSSYFTATSTTATTTIAGGLNVGSGSVVFEHSTGVLRLGESGDALSSPLVVNYWEPGSGIGARFIGSGGSGTGNIISAESTGAVSRFVVKSTGNVGIGTTSPYAKLSVVGEAVASHFTATSTTATSTFNGAINLANAAANGAGVILSNETRFVHNYTPAGAVNFFAGNNAGNLTLTGNVFGGNVGVGTNAATALTTGYYNVAVGKTALRFTTSGNLNTAIGVDALNANTTGSGNVGIGNGAGASYTTVANSTFIGYGSDALSDGLTNATAIGYNAWVGASNSIVLGGTGAAAVNVGIGTTSPYAKLSVVGEAVALHFTATSTTAMSTFTAGVNVGSGNGYFIGGSQIIDYDGSNLAVGASATASGGVSHAFGIDSTASGLLSTAFGFNNTASGINAIAMGYSNSATNTSSMALGNANSAGGSQSVAIGYQNKAYASNSIAIGSTITNNTASSLMIGPSDGAKLTILTSGNVGIGTTSPYAKLSIVGETVSSYFTATSTTATSTFNGGFAVGSGASPSGLVYDPSTGNVGIGTNAPTDRLHLYRDINGTANTFTLENPNAGVLAATTMTLKNNAGSIGTINTYSSSNISFPQFVSRFVFMTNSTNGNGIDIVSAKSTGNIRLYTGGSGTSNKRVEITSSGNVRIANGWLCVDDNDTCTGATTAGTVYAVGAYTTGADLAENYQAFEEGLTPGSIVSITDTQTISTTTVDSFGVKKAARGETVIGIVSTKPGLLLANSLLENIPVALQGRVPVKVNGEGGSIKVGDRITLSSTPGIGMKATTSSYTIGIALESFAGNDASTTGTITAFLNLSYSRLDPAIADGTILDGNGESSFWSVEEGSGRIKFISAGLDLNDQDIVSVRAITGSAGKWSIDATGKLVVDEVQARKVSAQEVTAQIFCVDDVCVDKDKFKAMMSESVQEGGSSDVQIQPQDDNSPVASDPEQPATGTASTTPSSDDDVSEENPIETSTTDPPVEEATEDIISVATSSDDYASTTSDAISN